MAAWQMSVIRLPVRDAGTPPAPGAAHGTNGRRGDATEHRNDGNKHPAADHVPSRNLAQPDKERSPTGKSG
jgi:hypothetical protein